MQNRLQPHVRGMITMICAMLIVPLMDATGKWLAMEENIPPGTISFMRFFVQGILSFAAIIIFSRGFGLKTQHLWGNLFRGCLLALGSLCFFTAVKYMPLADALAVFFVEPLILTVLSMIFLNEKVGWRRLSAVLVGLLGTVIVIQPSWSVFGWLSVLPAISAFLFAVYLVLNRKFGLNERPVVMQFYAGIGGSIMGIAVMIFGHAAAIPDLQFALPHTLFPWFMLLMIGVFAASGHLLVVRAFQLAPASILAPFQYVEIVMAVTVGLLFFGDFPSLSKWFGIAIIIGSGIYVFIRERKRSAEAEKAALSA
ncbi:EamA family transporter [Ochrobactrum sp. MR28]|nr:EamA family transporter [Ochrobactrum sp. MR28]MBX8817488.1 EamA family transporter [Ochrobactrum sp. MR31]